MFRYMSRIGVLCLLVILVACNAPKQESMQLVEDVDTGYSYGAAKTGEFIADPAMFRNSKLKLRIRNTTGDTSLDLYEFREQLENSYESVGYTITDGDNFGILLDINVRYFGQVTEMLPHEYTFLGRNAGAAAGGLIGAQQGDISGTFIGAAAGSVVGATVGEIIRHYATSETFIIISSVTMGTVMPDSVDDERTISFVTGKKIRDKKRNFKGFRTRDTLYLGVYAGGSRISKKDIIEEVRSRYLRILKDII